MRYLVISSSLSPDSRSRILAQIALEYLRRHDPASGYLDLAELPLPLCDGAAAYADANVEAVTPQIAAARGIILAAPIYNYDVNSAAKNLVELTGRAWNDKVVGFLCTAGGHGSYMSVMPFANSLMLDFRCLIIPRFVYAPRGAVDHDTYGDAAIRTRIEEHTVELIRVTDALYPFTG